MTFNAHALHEFLVHQNWDIHELLDAAAELVQEERDAQTHPAVVSLLESVHESLTTAAMEYEMSYK